MTPNATHTIIRRSLSAMLAAGLAGSILFGGVVAEDAGVAPQIDEQPAGSELAGTSEASVQPAQVLTEYEQVMSHLHSEHLREIAADWGLEGSPAINDRTVGELYSEHLREIAADW